MSSKMAKMKHVTTAIDKFINDQQITVNVFYRTTLFYTPEKILLWDGIYVLWKFDLGHWRK